jgi:hypothetical protein
VWNILLNSRILDVFERIIPLSLSLHTCLHIDIDTYAKKDTMCAFQMAATNAQKGNIEFGPLLALLQEGMQGYNFRGHKTTCFEQARVPTV